MPILTTNQDNLDADDFDKLFKQPLDAASRPSMNDTSLLSEGAEVKIRPLGREETYEDAFQKGESRPPLAEERHQKSLSEQPARDETKDSRSQKVRRMIMFIIIVLLFFLLAGGTGLVLAARGYVELPWGLTLSFLEQPPDKVLENARQNFGQMHSAHFKTTMDISLDFNQAGWQLFSSALSATGLDEGSEAGVDESPGAASLPISLTIDCEGDFFIKEENSAQQVGIEGNFVWEGLSLQLAAQIKKVADKLYFKVDEIPPLPFLSLILGGQDIKNKWYVVDPQGLKEVSGGTSSLDLYNQYSNPADLWADLSAENKQRLIDILTEFNRTHRDVLGIEKLSSEKVDGVLSYHYKITANPEALKRAVVDVMDLFPEIIPILGEYLEKSDVEVKASLEEFDIEESKKLVTEFLAGSYSYIVPHLNAVDLEIWIGKKDYFIRRAKASYNLPIDFLKRAEASELEQQIAGFINSLGISFSYEYSKINQPVEIKAPEEAVDIFEGLLSKPMEDARSKARDAKRRADLRTIVSGVEIYYAGQGKW